METTLVIQEKDLELVVSEKTLGSLTTNAIQIRDLVKSSIPKYDVSNYNDDNIDQAKKDKAALNKAAKVLNDKRIEIEREFTKPFAKFKEIVGETVTLIKECSAKIDGVVKANEAQYQDKKKAEIQAYFDENNVNLIDFGKIFNPSWLNKSMTMKAVKESVTYLLGQVESDIQSIESFTEDKDVLITFYKDCLNIGNTIQYANRLREQRERRIAAEAETKRLEEERLKREDEIRNTTTIETGITDINNERGSIPFDKPKTETQHPTQSEQNITECNEVEILTRAFKVKTTREKIIALGDFMNDNDIYFDKIDLDAMI